MDNSPVRQEKPPFFKSRKGRSVALWLSYFIFWGGAAAILPYIAVYFESINLSGRQIGQLTSIPFFVVMISSVAFGFIADLSKRNKLLLRICTVAMIIVLFIYPRASSFWALVPIVLLYSIFHTPTNPILDQTTLSVLDSPENYGKYRVGGSIGWGLMVLLSGFLIDTPGIGIRVIFYLNILYMVIFFFLISVIPTAEPREGQDRDEVSLKKLAQAVTRPGFLFLFLLIIIWGLGEATISNYLFLHIKHLGGSSVLMGTALAVSLVGEVITFSLASRIQSKLGPFRMILLAFVVLIAWLVMLSQVKNPNAIPLFQIFGGAGFALMQSGSVAYVNKRAPRGLGTTAQALRGGIYAGLGNGVGTLIGGALYEFYGTVSLFRTMALVEGVGLLAGILIFTWDTRRRRAVKE